MTQEFDIAVIGAGPAGLMAALWAARGNERVALLEKSDGLGGAFLATAGRHQNFLPSVSGADDFQTSGSSNVLRRLFRTWRPTHLRDFFQREMHIPFAENLETNGFVPEKDDPDAIRDVLQRAVVDVGVSTKRNCMVDLIVQEEGERFQLSSSTEVVHSKRVVLACGGHGKLQPSSVGHSFTIAKKLGHKILPAYPALVPLNSADHKLRALSGLKMPISWRAMLHQKVVGQGKGELEITETGFKGSAVLDASHYVVRDKAEVFISWGGFTREDWIPYLKARTRQALVKAISPEIPLELLQLLFDQGGLRGEMRTGLLDRGTSETLLNLLCDFRLPVSSACGFKHAGVSGGGVPLKEVNPSTLESRLCPGLFLCGELLDVFGPSGGYNLHWAFLTGRLAGESACKSFVT